MDGSGGDFQLLDPESKDRSVEADASRDAR